MTTILHTADWHLGASNAPPVYQQQAIPSLIKFAKEHGAEYILCVGDIFDKPNPNQEQLVQLLDLIADNKDIYFIFTVGNHDYVNKSCIRHNLEYLKVIEEKIQPDSNFTLIHPNYTTQFENFAVGVMSGWDSTHKFKESDLVSILAWHGTVPSLCFSGNKVSDNKAKKTLDAESILRSCGASYLALGDIHKHMKISDRCWYPGPPVQKAYSDEAGLVLLEMGKSLKDGGKALKITPYKFPLDLPKKISLDVTFKDGEDSEESIIKYVKKDVEKGQMLKLKFQMPLKIWASLHKDRIKDGLKDHCIELKLENEPVEEMKQRASMDKIAKAVTIQEEISILIEEDAYGLDKEKLSECCNQFVK
jgi:DNA repair exonuclease SbcCD nuclease subunit